MDMRITSLSLILPVIYFFTTARKMTLEWILALLLIAVIVTSQLFWHNPVKDTQIHTLDTTVAKTTVVLFILYTIYYKLSSKTLAVSYTAILACVLISFLLSSHYSSKIWCCKKHIISHGMLHISCMIATFYAFV